MTGMPMSVDDGRFLSARRTSNVQLANRGAGSCLLFALPVVASHAFRCLLCTCPKLPISC